MTSPRTANFSQGDVLVIFVAFPQQPPLGQVPSDSEAIQRGGLWGKVRPVLLVSHGRHNSMNDILVASFSGNVRSARRRGEYIIKRWREAGLDEESALRPRFHQAVKTDVVARPGTIHPDDYQGMIDTLRSVFNL